MDRTLACEAGNLGSTPNEDTIQETAEMLVFCLPLIFVQLFVTFYIKGVKMMMARFWFVVGGVIALVVAVIVVVVLEKHGLDGQKKNEPQKWNMLVHDLAYIVFAGMYTAILLHTANLVARALFGLIGLIILKEIDKSLGVNYLWIRNGKCLLHFCALVTLGGVVVFLVHISF